MTNIYLVGIGLLLIGLVAPAIAEISSNTAPLYSDTTSVIIIFLMLPIIVIAWVWAALSG